MPKLALDQVPSYRLHRQSGQAVVTLSGRDILLGKHGSRESRDKYNRFAAEWLANGRQLRMDPPASTVSMVICAYWSHCATYYGGDSGHGERRSIKLALGFVRRIYGPTPAVQFGPLALKAVRQAMSEAGAGRARGRDQGPRQRAGVGDDRAPTPYGNAPWRSVRDAHGWGTRHLTEG
ncbi:MAG TPA: hypothetical protein VFB66_13660 [Tepidisphaeraceae bacterium]|nr:hypothetical protein [Tepidisphaeraceae bacterium]